MIRSSTLSAYNKDWMRYLTVPGSMPGLDWLRAVAILMVMIWHANNAFQIGWTGVDLFFVLSGFLVGGSIISAFDDGNFRPAAYFRARFWRIYPLYIAGVLGFIGIMLFQGRMGIEDLAGTLFLHATFLQTLVPFFAPGMPVHLYDVTWSLVVEVCFYLLVPFILFALHRAGKWPLLLGLALIVALYPAVRAYIASPYMPDDYNWHYFLFLRPHYRLDELFYGVLAAAILHAFGRNMMIWSRWFLMAGLALLIGVYAYLLIGIPNPLQRPVMALVTRDSIWLPTALALGFALVLVWSVKIEWAPRPVVIVARLAYPLYLTHNLVRELGTSLFEYFIFSTAIATLASYCIEYPLIRMYKGEKTIPSIPSTGVTSAA